MYAYLLKDNVFCQVYKTKCFKVVGKTRDGYKLKTQSGLIFFVTTDEIESITEEECEG